MPSPEKEDHHHQNGKRGDKHHGKKESSAEIEGNFKRAPSSAVEGNSRTSSRASMAQAQPEKSLEESLVELKDWKVRITGWRA